MIAVSDLNIGTRAALERAEAQGAELFAVGPMTPGQTTPTADDRHTVPGVQAQIAHRGLLVPGFGSTADEAIMNALSKIL
jgi:hypothetical protein